MSLYSIVQSKADQLFTKSESSTPLHRLHPDLEYRQSTNFGTDMALRSYGDLAKTYRSYVWVRKAVTVKSNAIAPLRVFVADAKSNEEIESHELAQVLTYINDTQNSAELWGATSVNMDLAGEQFIEIVDDSRGRPAELWYLSPGEVNVLPDKTRSDYPAPAGYTYNDDNGRERDMIPIAPENMIHIKYFNPLSPYRGLGAITAVRNSILIDVYSQAWSMMFMKNSARPDYAIVSPEGLTKGEKQDIEEALISKFGGVRGSHKPIVLEKGVSDIKIFSWPPVDTQWLEQRHTSRDEIGAILGVPDEIMGFGRDTYENFDTAHFVLWSLTLVPAIQYRDAALTNFFTKTRPILKPGQIIKTDLSSVAVLQKDYSERLSQAQQLFSMGYSINDINDRLSLGMPEVPYGNIGRLPNNLIPANTAPRIDGVSQIATDIAEIKGLVTGMALQSSKSIQKKLIAKQQEGDTPAAIAEYEQALADLIEQASNGEIEREEFELQFEEIAAAILLAMFLAGARISDGDQTEEELDLIDAEIEITRERIPPLADDVYAGRYISQEGQSLELSIAAKVALWASTAAMLFEIGKTFRRDDPLLQWFITPGKDSCSTCLSLNGQVHRASEWRQIGFHPKGRNLECGGYNCGCYRLEVAA